MVDDENCERCCHGTGRHSCARAEGEPLLTEAQITEGIVAYQCWLTSGSDSIRNLVTSVLNAGLRARAEGEPCPD